MGNYLNKYNLINAQAGPKHLVNENTLLYTLAYVLYTGDAEYNSYMFYYSHLLKTEIPGLYNNLVSHSEISKDNATSPDQLIAIIALFSAFNHPAVNKRIWSYLWRHAFTYDNLQPGKINFQRTMQPMAILFSAVAAGIWVLNPLLALVCIISCMSMPERSSGAQKAYIVLKSLGMKTTLKVCEYIVKGWDKVWEIYYPDPNHPIRVLADIRSEATQEVKRVDS